MFALVALLPLGWIAGGCRGPQVHVVRLYDGEPRPVTQIARLVEMGDARLVTVDGNPLPKPRDARYWDEVEYHLDPGVHTLTFAPAGRALYVKAAGGEPAVSVDVEQLLLPGWTHWVETLTVSLGRNTYAEVVVEPAYETNANE